MNGTPLGGVHLRGVRVHDAHPRPYLAVQLQPAGAALSAVRGCFIGGGGGDGGGCLGCYFKSAVGGSLMSGLRD